MKPSVLISRLAVFILAGTGAVCAQTLELEPFERLPNPVMDPASDDAKLALQRFSLPQGLKASLWAAEPMLANPVAIDFDEKGRLFVSETYRYRSSVLDIRDYMGMLELDMAARTIEDRLALHKSVFGEKHKDFAIEGEVVRLVEDKDGDGKLSEDESKTLRADMEAKHNALLEKKDADKDGKLGPDEIKTAREAGEEIPMGRGGRRGPGGPGGREGKGPQDAPAGE